MNKYLALGAVCVGVTLSTGAFAQLEMDDGVARPLWAGTIGEAIFLDDTYMALRPTADLERNFENLTEPEKQSIRFDCENHAELTAGELSPEAAATIAEVDAAADPTANTELTNFSSATEIWTVVCALGAME